MLPLRNTPFWNLTHSVNFLCFLFGCLSPKWYALNVSTYACSIIGLKYGGRGAPAPARVHVGDAVELRYEPGSPYTPSAIAAFHGGKKVGYLPAEKRWIWKAIKDSERHEVVVVGEISDDDGELVGLDVEIFVNLDTAPPPGSAPMAPRMQAIKHRWSLSRLLVGIAVLLVTIGFIAAGNAGGTILP